MKYKRPETIEELIICLNQMDENCHICAGATDLMIKLRKMKMKDWSVLDITGVPDLQKIEEKEKRLSIGACVTMTKIEEHQVVCQKVPALAKAASMVGSTQIRNRATLGGNIANASQSADTVPVLMAYDAEAVILNQEGEIYRIPVQKLIVAREKTLLKKGEVIVAIEIPCEERISGFSKVGSRKAVTISKINGCMTYYLDQNGAIEEPRLFLGAAGVKASEAKVIEEALTGKKPEQISIEMLREPMEQQMEINIGNRPSKHYKKIAALGVMDDILQQCIRGTMEK